MTGLTVLVAPIGMALPTLIAKADHRAQQCFLEFFAATIRNVNTRRAYARGCGEFLDWCADRAVIQLDQVQPLHVAEWIEELGRRVSAPTVKQRLAGVRHMFDCMVTGQIVPMNPASSVRGPSHSVRRSKTPVLDAKEARLLLDTIDVAKPVGLRDRALIGVMVYSFARVGAALAMRIEDVYVQNRRLWVRLHEKGGKQHQMPCHHNLEEYLTAYLDGCSLREDREAPLFRTIDRHTRQFGNTPLPQSNAFQMVRRRAIAAGIETPIGNHSFRATGITAYLKNGGTLERAALMANHASTRTTKLYDRRHDKVTLDEVERVLI